MLYFGKIVKMMTKVTEFQQNLSRISRENQKQLSYSAEEFSSCQDKHSGDFLWIILRNAAQSEQLIT